MKILIKIHSKRCHQPKLTYPITTAHAVFLLSRSFFSFFLPQADYNQWEMKKDTSTSGSFPCKI